MAPSLRPIRTLVADDEKLARSLLAQLVRQHAQLDLVAVSASAGDALTQARQSRPELALLDIEMPGENGLHLGNRLGHLPAPPLLVYVTAHGDYALPATQQGALGYLLKPVAKDRFTETMDRAVRLCRSRSRAALAPALVVRHGDEPVALAADDIHWLEGASQYVRVHTNHQAFLLARSLQAVHQDLPQDQFLRVHRSAIINRDLIRRLHRAGSAFRIELLSGAQVPLSRSRRHLLEDLLMAARDNRVEASHGG